MTSKQHRCVFVGNIPYDATEEQLVRICEEVGPVVSFRLVLDRETGKPKGYGFCEYRDEETALSARRNLQGYEINGRQLRVDFAENEKGSADRNREQGRGGPGLQVTEVQKQTAGPKAVRDPYLHQPIGLPAAASAAVAMAGMLGAPQASVGIRNGGMPVGTDALSTHLAATSRLQLYEVIYQMKNLIQQNQQQARQLLTAHPQLTKALLQAQIMLGLVRLPPMAGAPPPLSGHQNIPQLAAMQPQQAQPQLHIGQLQQAHQPNQSVNIAPQMNQISQSLQFQPAAQLHQQLGVATAGMLLPSQHASSLQPQNTVLQRSQPQALANVHHQPPLPQLPRPVVPPSPPQPQTSQGASFQLPSGSQAPFQAPVMAHNNVGIPYPAMNPPLPSQPPPQHGLQMPRSGSDAGGIATGQGLQPSSVGAFTGSLNTTLGGGRGPNMGGSNLSAPLMTRSQPPSLSGPTATTSLNMLTGPGLSKIGPPAIPQGSGMQSQIQQQGQPQVQQQQGQVTLEPEQQKALLQQVMNLTAEQIDSLPSEQRQQVLQLQQAVRNQTI